MTTRTTLFERLTLAMQDWMVLAILIGVAVLTTLVSYGFGVSTRPGWLEGFWQNFSTEMYGAFLTFLLIEVLVGAREKRQDAELQQRIAADTRQQIRGLMQWQAVSRLRAAETIEARQIILDEMKANDLLAGASLIRLNLTGTNLIDANLAGADLKWTNLHGAHLRRADLTGADLGRADLSGAELRDAILADADLHHANLKDAERVTLDQLKQAAILADVTLPDGTRLPDDESWHAALSGRESA